MRRIFLLLAASLVAGCTASDPAAPELSAVDTAPVSAPAAAPPVVEIEAPPVTKRAYSAIVVDVKSGKILHEEQNQSF